MGLKKREEALEIYRDLARQHPGDWRIPEALGYLASYSGNRESARRHFARAIEQEAANPRLYYDFARLLQEADAEPEIIKAVLRKAIALKPDFDDAHRLLGSILLLEGKPEWPWPVDAGQANQPSGSRSPLPDSGPTLPPDGQA